MEFCFVTPLKIQNKDQNYINKMSISWYEWDLELSFYHPRFFEPFDQNLRRVGFEKWLRRVTSMTFNHVLRGAKWDTSDFVHKIKFYGQKCEFFVNTEYTFVWQNSFRYIKVIFWILVNIESNFLGQNSFLYTQVISFHVSDFTRTEFNSVWHNLVLSTKVISFHKSDFREDRIKICVTKSSLSTNVTFV